MAIIVSFDIGSTGCKACLYRVDSTVELLAAGYATYRFTYLADGGVEQDPDDWWHAMAVAMERIVAHRPRETATCEAVSFCAQMQGLVLVDGDLRPVRPAMSYMDQRAVGIKERIVGGFPAVEGFALHRLVTSVRINGAAAVSVKDPVWKYHWVREHEPDAFRRVHTWLDVKDYLIARCTGSCTMTRDSAFTTFLTDERRPPSRWSPRLARMYGVEVDHLPDIIDASDAAGILRPDAADHLRLPTGVPVFGGGGDASAITVGSGAITTGDTYIYTGTSGWVSQAVTRRSVDIKTHIASVVGAQSGVYNYFAEQETAGKCLEWVKDHLALDEINLYLERSLVTDDPAGRFADVYQYLTDTIAMVPPGSEGVVFTPWLHGNRAPFEDTSARGIFFNLSLTTGKRTMIRAVVEGICLHQRWLVDGIRRRFPVNGPVRFSGGGALSPVVAQILADVLELPVVPVVEPQNVGAAGAALIAAVGLGTIPDLGRTADWVPVGSPVTPRPEFFSVYRRNYTVLRELYRRNKGLFTRLNTR